MEPRGGAIAVWQSQYAFFIGFPLGLMLYRVLTTAVALKSHPQAEIESGYASDYLAPSDGLSWVYTGQGRFARMTPEQVRAESLEREDL